jgi:sigma-E factor negative regulatory protein RseB
MRIRTLSALILLKGVLLLLLSFVALAQDNLAAGSEGSSTVGSSEQRGLRQGEQGRVDALSDEVVAWFEKMSEAAITQSFMGDFIYYQDDRLETYRVFYEVKDQRIRERLEALNGPEREVIKVNGEVVCNFLSGDLAGFSQRIFSPVAIFSREELERLTGVYRVAINGKGRVASRDVVNLEIFPESEDRYGYRLSLDEQTGMLLELLVLDPEGKTVEQLLFVDIVFTGDFGDAIFSPPHSSFGQQGKKGERTTGSEQQDLAAKEGAGLNADPSGSRDEIPVVQNLAGESGMASAAKWQVQSSPPGFELKHHEQIVVSSGQVEHLLFSDGLASVSIYIEMAGDQDPIYEGYSTVGAINTMGFRHSGHQVTLVGEVPRALLMQWAEALHYLEGNK